MSHEAAPTIWPLHREGHPAFEQGPGGRLVPVGERVLAVHLRAHLSVSIAGEAAVACDPARLANVGLSTTSLFATVDGDDTVWVLHWPLEAIAGLELHDDLLLVQGTTPLPAGAHEASRLWLDGLERVDSAGPASALGVAVEAAGTIAGRTGRAATWTADGPVRTALFD